MEYLDFELEVQTGSGRDYPVAVLNSPAGEARAVMHFPYDQLALESRLDKLQIALLRSGGKPRSLLSREERSVQEFGQALFEALFTGEVRSRYDISCERARHEDRGLRLKLRIQSPELAALPWEFLYDPRRADYICLSRETPIVRYLELPQPVPFFKVTPPLRILGMVASPSNLPGLDADRERERVERAIADLRARGLVELVWLQGQTWRDLQRAMRGGPWHVFHFVGHGSYDANRDEGLLALVGDNGQSEYLPATQLARLLADHPSLRFVLLNACEGARAGERDIFSSTASILVRRNIPAVIAMQYAITDRAAIEFARAFYEALADGMPVDVAASEARKSVSVAVANTMEWGTPVLYMRTPDGVLFDLESSTLPIEAPARPHEKSAPTEDTKAIAVAGRGIRKRNAVIGALIAAAIVGGAVIGLIWRPNAKLEPAPTDTLPAGMTAAAPEAMVSGTLTSPPTRVIGAPAPLYRSGVITYVRSKDGKKTLYALDPDGTSRPLLGDVADLVVVSTSPDHRYAAVVSSQKDLNWAGNSMNGRRFVELADGVANLDVLSLDGTQRNRVLTDVRGGLWATYAGDERLIALAVEGDDSSKTFTYYAAQPDGRGVRELYRTKGHYGSAPAPAPSAEPQAPPTGGP
jgi:CHAT domain